MIAEKLNTRKSERSLPKKHECSNCVHLQEIIGSRINSEIMCGLKGTFVYATTIKGCIHRQLNEKQSK